MSGYVYLASPYSHADPEVVEQRYEAVLAATAAFMDEGYFVYSPIVHGHELARRHDLPTDHAFWRGQNEAMLEHAAALWVLKLDLWALSVGVAFEIGFAREHGIGVLFVDPPA